MKENEKENFCNNRKNRLSRNLNKDNICAKSKNNKGKSKNNNTIKSSTTEISLKPKKITSIVNITTILLKNNKNYKTSIKTEQWKLRLKKKNKEFKTKKRIMKLFK
jgi:hypothetical protein